MRARAKRGLTAIAAMAWLAVASGVYSAMVTGGNGWGLLHWPYRLVFP